MLSCASHAFWPDVHSLSQTHAPAEHTSPYEHDDDVQYQQPVTLLCAQFLQPFLAAHSLVDPVNAVGGLLVFCVALVVLAFNYLGDGLRDALDPRLAGTE